MNLHAENEQSRAAVTAAKVKFDNLSCIRHEMALIYSEVRAGKIKIEEACRLIYILNNIGRIWADEWRMSAY